MTPPGPAIAVVAALYNEERNIGRLLTALREQTLPPHEIVLADDGSTDRTAELVAAAAVNDPRIRLEKGTNRGPAAARNRAWRGATAPLRAFTDGDCLPDPDWLERLAAPLVDDAVLGAAGTYRTLNPGSLLARFIGLEIDWRYRDVGGSVDCHGTYNLLLRASALERLGGFDESYRFPSGEDFELTYRVSREGRLAFVREAVVGHDHPERLGPYLRSQSRRARDRVRLYSVHPGKLASDSYTSPTDKYSIVASWLVLASPLVALVAPEAAIPAGTVALIAFLALAAPRLIWIGSRSAGAAGYGAAVMFARSIAWGGGVIAGLVDGFSRSGAKRS